MVNKSKNKSNPTEEIALRNLKKAELRVTKPRLLVLSFMIRSHGPFTLEEIHQEIKGEGIDLVTVYRCINSFQESGIIHRCDFGDGPMRFEYEGEGSEHHHHIVCKRCREVKSLDYCLVEGIEKLLRKEGYSHITHSLEFFGVCSKCGAET